MDRIPSSRYLLFAVPAMVGCAADLVTKAWFFSWPELRAGDIYWLWTGHIGIQLSWNEGALFGFGQGAVWFFVAMSAAAAIAIPLWLFHYGAARDGWLALALGCVMAGVLGNLYDRLGLHGEVWPAHHPQAGDLAHAVRDWMLWQANDRWRWPNFNIADSMLVVGAGLIVLHALRHSGVAATNSTDETLKPSKSAVK